MAAHTEVREQDYRGGTIVVKTVSPDYAQEERESIKKAMEEQLYDIFSKYASR